MPNSGAIAQQPGNGFNSPGGNVPRATVPISTAPPHTFHQYQIPNCNAQLNQSYCLPHGLAVGPDRLYYTLQASNLVGSMSYTGNFGPQTSTGASPNGLIEGLNGGLFIATNGTSTLGELAAGAFGGNIYGSWNDFGVTSGGTNQVVSDPNGVLWFTEYNNNSLIRMTTYGSLLSRVTLPAGSGPSGIAVGNDNNVYVTEPGTNQIAKIDLNGNVLSQIAVTSGTVPARIAAGADGNVYFTEYPGDGCTGNGYIGKITSTGTLTMIPVNDCHGVGIASGIDGNIYFAQHYAEQIGEYNTSTQAITYYAIPTGEHRPYELVSGPDGQIWFTTQNSPYITSFHP